jgi:hypothetical protein
MTELKLTKLPDRTPVKITFVAMSDLNQALQDYAAIYRATYGQSESIADLIPFMLESFLDGDRAFQKARKEIEPGSDAAANGRTRRQLQPAPFNSSPHSNNKEA